MTRPTNPTRRATTTAARRRVQNIDVKAPGKAQGERKARRAITPTEAQIQASILEYLAWRGAVAIRVNSGMFRSMDGQRIAKGAAKGTSDIVCCFRGRFVSIEVKKRGGKLREDQGYFLERVEQAGGVAVVAFGLEDVERALNDIEAKR